MHEKMHLSQHLFRKIYFYSPQKSELSYAKIDEKTHTFTVVAKFRQNLPLTYPFPLSLMYYIKINIVISQRFLMNPDLTNAITTTIVFFKLLSVPFQVHNPFSGLNGVKQW